jgi:hypothetical protein
MQSSGVSGYPGKSLLATVDHGEIGISVAPPYGLEGLVLKRHDRPI